MRDISKLISAVKPRARTDQYKILSALYCLDADTKPAAVAEIGALLKLHFGASIPGNISASLRKYIPLVRAEQGTPLRWTLTSVGLDKLRTLSGTDLRAHEDEDDYQADIGIICALEHPEFEAVILAAGGPACWDSAGSSKFPHVYRACEITSESGEKLKVVGTTSTSMGLTAASIVTTQLILQYRPRIVLMIGIAAGTKDGGKNFGDVLVADPSIDYNSGKVVRASGIREFLPDPYPIGLNPRLRSVLQKYRGSSHPLFESIRSDWKAQKPGTHNRLFVGPVGAADQVIDDESRVVEIQRNWRKLIGVEMETYGVYRACYEAPDPKPRFVSFKAVCDFAAEKGDSWQQYAAYVAAQFAFRFIKAEWSAIRPK